jgi:hypothetical protein
MWMMAMRTELGIIFFLCFAASLPPFPGKRIDFPGVYSCVDDGLVGLCARAVFIFSSVMKKCPHKSNSIAQTDGCAKVHISFPRTIIKCNNILKMNSANKKVQTV